MLAASIEPAGHTLGFYVAVIGFPLLVVVLAAAIAIGVLADKMLGLIATAAVLFVIVVSAVSYYPFGNDWHTRYVVKGTVTAEPEKRIISDGKSMSERVVLMLDGQPFGVDDTRAASVKVGDKVKLNCQREWVYASRAGWKCNWS